MDIMTFGGEICEGVLVKDYEVYMKWIKDWANVLQLAWAIIQKFYS